MICPLVGTGRDLVNFESYSVFNSIVKSRISHNMTHLNLLNVRESTQQLEQNEFGQFLDAGYFTISKNVPLQFSVSTMQSVHK